MIRFRGSRSGSCTRELVMAELRPETVGMPPHKRDFGNTGHYLQRQVEDIIREEGFRLLGSEGEGIHNCGDFEIVGHVDGILEVEGDPSPALLEVKAIQHKNFVKLRAAQDWRDRYANYVPQAQCYLNFSSIEHSDTKGDTNKYYGEVVHGPFSAMYFVFFDRDTSDMLGGLALARPNYEYRADMILPPSEHVWLDILNRHQDACNCIVDNYIPDYCDKDGYCFFCGRGIPKKDPRA